MKKRLIALIALLVCVLTVPTFAAGTFMIDDGAGLFTDEEEALLAERYVPLTEFFDIAVVTADSVSGTTRRFAEDYAYSHYGSTPAILFVIDMDNREIYICTNSTAKKTVSNADSRAITDNVYREASRGDYFACTDSALDQLLARCRGEKLARPVKHVTNALIAVLFGVLINYFIVAASRKPTAERRTKGKVNVSVSRAMAAMPGIALAAPLLVDSVKHYKERSSGGGGRGGFGGGGGFSGGGGGHKF